ncbi:dipeptide ABC transporter ATP-binding protein [Aquabacterium sp.]|uniref:ABC transporter ATP-binding protein n=1 Tax=Aquabacterium sp. TaxID=1872578 RepID=UPI0024871B73|nr:dipeptide ABC transporter ATP-binding protein [Aquabacterium sp.]MDI1261403.1 dipeptide ABC transporter ATP-binding protein [Aquabacterium sp.]
MSAVKPLLSVRDLRIRFGSKTVVQGVSFDLMPGEKLALVGESGSGKTITALSLLKLVPQAHTEGSAVLDVVPDGPRDLLGLSEQQLRGVRGRDVAVIFQEPMTALNPLFTIGDQIAEVIELHEGLSKSEAWQRAVALLASTGIPEPDRRAGAYPHQLSGGQRQRAMIAMALACQPKLLLADEPTTALDVTLRQQVLGLLDDLQRSHQMAVLMITHDLNLVRNFADRVAVMEKGLLVEQGTVDEVFGNPQHPYTRKLLDSRPHRDVVEASANAAPQQPVLQAKQLRVGYRVPKPGFKGWFSHGEYVAVKSADLQLAPGQTLGVIGESGSGKSTLALAALGLLPFQGHLQITGQSWQLNARADKPLRRTIQVVFQDPFSSLSPRMTVEDLVTEGLTIHHPGLNQAQRRTQALATLADVGLTEEQFPQLLERYPHEFSGGQRQRLALARALVVDPQALVLDEPTSALDVTIQKQILSLLQRLQRERGLSYLLITHDVEVVAAMAHHIIVMKDGDIVESGPALQVLQSPRHDYTRALLAAVPARAVIKS